jgi:Ca2+/Na+ antiporter
VSSLAALALLLAGVALVVVGADLFFRVLLALAARLRLPPSPSPSSGGSRRGRHAREGGAPTNLVLLAGC